MSDNKRVLELCVLLGEIILKNGGEIFRVQDTMELVAKAYGVKSLHVYVLTNGVFASVDDESCSHNAEIRHCPTSWVHLGRIVAVNSLSRHIVEGKISIEQAFEKAEEIAQMSRSKNIVHIFACAVGAAAFAYLFGGTVFDAAAAFVAGLILQLFLIFERKHPMGKIMSNIIASGLVALISFALFSLGIGDNMDKIIIGGIIPLLPGMALTTSIRDFANTDYLSGTIRLVDTLLIGGSIATGVGFVLKMISLITGVNV